MSVHLILWQEVKVGICREKAAVLPPLQYMGLYMEGSKLELILADP